jgi:hypothetical protein
MGAGTGWATAQMNQAASWGTTVYKQILLNEN